ncbi:MAG TPA: neutral/alkaline non-lysosomal ceramidase N-terminal domain-containing protein [Lacipirellulaceae bacterium]|nr:neutral/alkaline non-lysosomal ceramidase N-terminal domain-containing protein [Lacipirellulaceae bacterium]
MIRLILVVLLALFVHLGPAHGADRPWKAGVARVNISPELPIWLSGYGGRNKPAQDKLDDLWAKALVLEDADGHRAVLVTMDLVGIDRELSREVCRRIEEQFKLPRATIALSTSHTHSGPVVRSNLAAMYSLDQRDTKRIEDYAIELETKLIKVVADAFEQLAPARLSWTTGKATFAVNRRNNPEGDVPRRQREQGLVGPVDHDLPVLAIHSVGEKPELRAIVAGYACHATVLSEYSLSADWPGVGQNELERRHPGTAVLFWAGCGADQNPLPRRSIDWLNRHGRAFADAVDVALNSPLKPIDSKLSTAYEEIDLKFAARPSREELESTAAGEPPQATWAKYLLQVWDRDGGLPAIYPYPIQVWRLGDEINWLFLGGEVVVDYSLRLKSELGRDTTWVASYSNDVMGYIPSQRVLAEGGYEGGGSRIPYGLPAVWTPEAEPQIVDTVHRLVREVQSSSGAEE